MTNINTVVLSGALAADPEVRWISDDGESVIVRLGIIVKHSKKNQETDEYEDVSKIIDVEVFGKYARLIARKLKKFDDVTIQGRLDRDEWETEGQKRSKIKVVGLTLDSPGFFRNKDEDNEVVLSEFSGGPAQASIPGADATPAAAAAPTADDIPF